MVVSITIIQIKLQGWSGAVYLVKHSMALFGEKCHLTMGKKHDNPILYTIVLQKSSPYTEPFNRKFGIRFVFLLLLTNIFSSRIQEMYENGILSVLKKKYVATHKVAKCMDRKVQRSNQTPLTLYDLSSTFILLGLGISLALLSFLVELAIEFRGNRLRRI